MICKLTPETDTRRLAQERHLSRFLASETAWIPELFGGPASPGLSGTFRNIGVGWDLSSCMVPQVVSLQARSQESTG